MSFQANQTQIPVVNTSDQNLTTVQQNVNKVLRNLHNQITDIELTNGLTVDVNGTLVSTEPELNFIQGTGISVSGVHNVPLNRIDLTITNSGSGGGSVTSIAFADGSTAPIFSISGSPITTSGTITETLVTQTANKVFAGPTSGGAAQPTFRSLVAADVPFAAINSFTTIATPAGTSPVADSPTDTLTLTSTDSTVTITGNSTTDTIDFSVASSASPGFSWGRSGALVANTYLLNDTVPSNVTGRVVPLTTGTIKRAVIACGTSSTFDIKVQKRSGVSFVDLFTVSVVASRTSVSTQAQSVSSGDELAVLVSSGSTDNLVVSLIMVGTD